MIQNNRVLTVVWSVILAVGIGLVGQGVWTAMLVGNLRTSPSIPWSPVVIAVIMWMMWRYLRRKRDYLRADLPPGPVFAWALLAGALSLAALTGYWIVLMHWMGTPANSAPDLSQYPPLTTVLVGLMGMLVSPLFEQAGFWGYCQVTLERKFSGPAAVTITALIFALLPHPPLNGAWWPRLIFYFLTGLVFGTTAYLTKSILPGIAIHISGFVVFSSLVWPHDATRPWDGWAWIHVAQAILFTALAVLAFRRLKHGDPGMPRRIRAVLSSTVLAFLILAMGSGAWITLLTINLKAGPAYPWAVPVMAAVLYLMWRYLGGDGWPRKTSEVRRRLLNANPVSGRIFVWALLAGVLSMIALAGCWIVMFQLVKMPPNALPDASKALVVMSSLVAPITEEAGFRGYCQMILQRPFRCT
jgi:membrane protease YdiL (CAAX protease family)